MEAWAGELELVYSSGYQETFFHVTVWEADAAGASERGAGVLLGVLQCPGQTPLWRTIRPKRSARHGGEPSLAVWRTDSQFQ